MVGDQDGQLSQVQSRVSGITISGDAFGKLPNAHHLLQEYNDHVDANRKNLADLIEALNQTSEALNGTAQNYLQHEQELGAGLGGGQ
ncbi:MULTISPECIES: hypothetical protein [Kitasatospora]|uniref:ESX-1 secretion-associated protein n=1 Tax=Kitasatospora cystarginea TaxID=58350 RepID=A0ABN3ET16_9ACTN